MGDLLGSPRVAPFSLFMTGFLRFMSALVVPIGSALPISIRTGRSSIGSPDRQLSAVEIDRQLSAVEIDRRRFFPFSHT